MFFRLQPYRPVLICFDYFTALQKCHHLRVFYSLITKEFSSLRCSLSLMVYSELQELAHIYSVFFNQELTRGILIKI